MCYSLCSVDGLLLCIQFHHTQVEEESVKYVNLTVASEKNRHRYSVSQIECQESFLFCFKSVKKCTQTNK